MDINGSLNIVVTIPMNEVLVRRVIDIGKRIKLTSVFDCMYEDMGGDPEAAKKLDSILADAEIIFGYQLPRNVVARAPRLKWVQLITAGVEKVLTEDVRQSKITLTNVRGIHAVPIGEFVLCQMLMLAKGAQQSFHQQRQKLWKPYVPSMLYAKTVGIVGLGSIGREIARLSHAFGMRVLGVRRSDLRGKTIRYVDEIIPTAQLDKMLSDSDYVVLTVPLTEETRHMIGEQELRCMKPTAFLINVARGQVVDEDALVRALEQNRLAGASLDVFHTEPLPDNSRLWDMPNVIITPHSAGNMECYAEQATDIFCENLKRYLAGQKLLRIVDKKKGY